MIRSFNQDLPYDEFVRRQLAGDVQPAGADGLAAAGFLVAGPHNTTLPQSQKMRMSMRQDEVEDLVGVISQTFLGLTANCARCHDHKFDPISQREYYQLAAALAGVQHGQRELVTAQDRQRRSRIKELKATAAQLRQQLSELDEIAVARLRAQDAAADRPQPPRPLARWEFDSDLQDSIGALHGTAHGAARVEGGALLVDGESFVETAALPTEVKEKTLEAWVRIDGLDQRGGGVISLQTRGGGEFDAIVFGEREPRRWMAGSNGFVRTQSFQGPAEQRAEEQAVHVAIVYQQDGTIIGYRDGAAYGKPYDSGQLKTFPAGACVVVFGLRHSPPGGNRLLTGAILRAQLYDRALSAAEVAASAGVALYSEQQRLAALEPKQRQGRQAWRAELERVQSEQQRLQAVKVRMVYTNSPQDPGAIRVLRRGDVSQPQEVVSAAGVRAVQGVSADFNLSPEAADAQRRQRLADWVSHQANPLFARVIVNRLWHHHFGAGLVDTPNDFGFNGGRPSHPQLLDYLALDLRRHNWRLKAIHRLIVTSATYRQSAALNDQAVLQDADNRLLWRRAPRRLEAEALRDAILSVAGQLDARTGGVGYRDVRHFKYRGSNFYDPLREDGPEYFRRTVYRFTPRGGRNPFLDTFDCPDPSTTTPTRASTTTPLQALVLQNNDFVMQTAGHFADRVRELAGDDAARQSEWLFRLAYGRPATTDEAELLAPFLAAHGLPALCRVVLNSNEFLYVR